MSTGIWARLRDKEANDIPCFTVDPMWISQAQHLLSQYSWFCCHWEYLCTYNLNLMSWVLFSAFHIQAKFNEVKNATSAYIICVWRVADFIIYWDFSPLNMEYSFRYIHPPSYDSLNFFTLYFIVHSATGPIDSVPGGISICVYCVWLTEKVIDLFITSITYFFLLRKFQIVSTRVWNVQIIVFSHYYSIVVLPTELHFLINWASCLHPSSHSPSHW